jgi:2,5-diketo-D-gluconate reductase A
MAIQPTLTLNDGSTIPQLGFGCWQIANEKAGCIVEAAISEGYRLIDTASIYGNEEGVGDAIQATSVPRAELFITTKLWNDSHGYDAAFRAFDRSLKRLKLDYVDLYLIHWPVPRLDAYVDTWRALAELKRQNRARSIGVSNFNILHIQRLIAETGILPAVNQIELHPRFQQRDLRAVSHANYGILTECWSPLGRGTLLTDETFLDLARKYGKTPAQIILRWHLDNGFVIIPKSVTPSRIRENFAVFDFNLEADDLERISDLDTTFEPHRC